jgi:endonuclease III
MPKESKAALKARALEIAARLDSEYPDATCALHWRTPWELLTATILSAQCTDEKVNQVTPELFERYPTVQGFATADVEELEQIVHPTGFYHNKSKSLIGSAQMIVAEFGGEVPQTMVELLTLPGVARKTSNVVLGTAFGVAEGVVVDTHVSRLALRMALTPRQKTKALNIEKIEADLMALIPQGQWVKFAHCMTWHGRRVCTAKKAWCERCVVEELCPKVGVTKR